MYQALYRKYRPRTFDDVAGQEHITETLKRQVASGRFSHAYLFIGTRGTGKTSCAKILAKAVNCEHPISGNPCNVCNSCRGIDDGSILDVVEIDAASNNSVDNVRALRDEAVFSPAGVKKRVYIIDEVHMLSTAAFNALLKILEEPPDHLMFILATTELRKVPATILSRCQRYSFRRLGGSAISQRLNYVAESEGLSLTPDAAELLARLAEGSLRDGLSLLDQCSGADVIDTEAVLSAMGLAGSRRTAELFCALADKDSQKALSIFDSLWRDGKDPSTLLGDISALIRDVLILSVAPVKGAELLSGAYDQKTLLGFSGRMTDAELLRTGGRIQDVLMSLKDNPSPRTAVELCLVSLCEPKLFDGLPELLARVSRLEEKGLPFPAAFCAQPDSQKEMETQPQCNESEPDAWREPEPEPDPEPESEFESAQEVKEAPLTERHSGEFSWEALTALMKTRIPVGLYNLLSDPLQVSGEYSGGRLVLHIAKGFTFDMLNKQDIIAQFREAAATLTGNSTIVSLSEMDSGDKLATRNLEELERFKQVKFI